ncbi:bifunctional diguanylate cyclase/phosphodiesterase [Naasia aerilata]|nr:PAS domain S-box protein [Naasia aerilata]
MSRSRDLFAGVLDAATEQSIIATDAQGLITVFNTGAERMLGYTAEEMIGTSPERLHDPAEIRARAEDLGLPADFGVFLARPATGQPETRQWTYITRDGRRLLASITVSAMRGPRGEVTGFIKVGTDITELSRSRDLFAGVLDAATEQSIIATDPQGLITVFNTGAERMLGYTAEEMIGTSPERLHDPAEIRARAEDLGLPADFGVFLARPATGQPETRQWTYITRDGRRLLASITVSAMRGPRGEVTGFIKVGTDITELSRSRDLFAGVLDAATEQSIIATDPQGLITVFNTGAERMLGYTAEEMIGTSPERLHDPAEIRARAEDLGLPADFGVFLARPATGQPETRQWTYITRDGRRLLASITVSAMRGPRGEVTGFIKVGTDITELNRSRAALQESESRFRDLFQYAPNGMMLVGVGADNAGQFLQVNPAMTRLTGYSEGQLLAMTMSDLAAPADSESPTTGPVALTPDLTIGGSLERHWVHADGSELWVQLSLSPTESTTADASVVGQVEDITARKRAEAALRHQALHDGLTGLPNRVLLMDRIEHALSKSVRTGTRIGVLYIDLDGFKGINDSAGHTAGDRALVHVANQVGAVLRPGDTFARLGGDEFMVVCEGIESADAVTAVARRVLAAIRTPFRVDGEAFALSGSIGVRISEARSSPEQLLHEADQAMYVAKGSGKGRIEVGGPDSEAQLARTAQAKRHMRLSAELRQAVERDELILYGQPVLDLRSGQVVAVESLLRWMHPELSVLAPGDFLDVAEATDLIFPIGSRVLGEACRMAATWVDLLGPAAPSIHVNISGRQLEGGNLHREVLRALAGTGLDPSQLVLELTETHMPLIANSLKNDLQGLRDRGVKVAIDDLGTGYSSLTRITELPVDILKIDMSFVARMEEDPASAAVVRGILSIGDALGLDVIAEGVETPSQAVRLGEYGCTGVQGYLYSRPLPEEELLAHLAKAGR